jgi:Tfp pilus assembly PilM family ATPase
MKILKSKSRTGWIGVDVGSHSVKLAQVAEVEGEIQLRQAISIPRQTPWPDDLSQLQIPFSSEEELTVATTLCSSFFGYKAAATISMAACDVRRLAMPKDLKSTEQFVTDELSGVDRFRNSSRQLDFWQDDLQGLDQTTGIHVLSTPGNWIGQLAADVSRIGMDCEIVDGVPFAMTRAYSGFSDSPEPVALLDWGYSRATLTVVQNGKPRFVRMLRKSGLVNVLQELVDGFGLDLPEAGQVLGKYGLPNHIACDVDLSARDAAELKTRHQHEKGSHQVELPMGRIAMESGAVSPSNAAQDEICDECRDLGGGFREIQNTVADLIIDRIDEVALEVQRTLGFLELQQQTLLPTQMVLLGGGALIRNISSLFSEKFGIPVEPWNPQMTNLAGLESASPTFANAIAMSLLSLKELEAGDR